MAERNSFKVLSVRINAQSFASILERVLHAPEAGERLALHFATAHSLVEAQDRPDLRAALAAGIVEPDGMPLVWLGRRGGVSVERVCGPDFLPAVVERGIALGRSHYFYGGAPGVPQELAARLSKRFPGMRVVGAESPPYRQLTRDEDCEVVDRINAARPDYVWVGLGAPKQDLWVASHRDALDAPVLLAVGAAFDFHAGTRRRAPRWMQRSGIEWAYRLLSEPRRLGGRYIFGNARFVGSVVAERRRDRRSA
jgi:N-acetylglucosaminyldiphosphoundecaprenol N-acetyl-beta-D-mannosaminyltransferase